MKKSSVLLILYCIFSCFMVSCSNRDKPAPVQELTWAAQNLKKGLYKVKKGDTLYSIAFNYDLDIDVLAGSNHIKPPYTIKPGRLIDLKINRLVHHNLRKDNKFARLGKPNFAWQWPVKGRILSSFNPRQGKKGIELLSKMRAPVYAAQNGVVAYAGNGLPGYKNLVLIKHSQHYLSAYACNSELYVKEGQIVKRGQRIAQTGVLNKRRWGLQFQIRKRGVPINPLKYLPKG